MPNLYPPISFHFKVAVDGLTANGDDLRFTDVAGLSVELGTEDVAEGGENRFVQKYPSHAKYPTLVLKRGLTVGSGIIAWARQCVDEMKITPRDIYITLLDRGHNPLMTWHVAKAYPTKWSVADLNAQASTYAVESIEFAYQNFTLDPKPAPPN
jgi:phage tail-like protein